MHIIKTQALTIIIIRSIALTELADRRVGRVRKINNIIAVKRVAIIYMQLITRHR